MFNLINKEMRSKLIMKYIFFLSNFQIFMKYVKNIQIAVLWEMWSQLIVSIFAFLFVFWPKKFHLFLNYCMVFSTFKIKNKHYK